MTADEVPGLSSGLALPCPDDVLEGLRRDVSVLVWTKSLEGGSVILLPEDFDHPHQHHATLANCSGSLC
jgi:hypothetical protein